MRVRNFGRIISLARSSATPTGPFSFYNEPLINPA
jgi:hypothetical protein